MSLKIFTMEKDQSEQSDLWLPGNNLGEMDLEMNALITHYFLSSNLLESDEIPSAGMAGFGIQRSIPSRARDNDCAFASRTPRSCSAWFNALDS